MTRRRGFSVIELLTAVMIFVILGGAVITSFWLFWNAYYSDRDYVTAREEIEYAFQILGRDVTNISVGMPNNRSTSGDFSESFRGSDSMAGNPGDSDYPIMFYMGEQNAAWGGPIAMTSDNTDWVTETVKYSNTDVYAGAEMVYATGIPVWGEHNGMRSVLKVDATNSNRYVSGNTNITFTLQQDNGVRQLQDHREDRREAGVRIGPTNDPRSWMLLPGLQLPLLVTGLDIGANTVTAQIAPHSKLSLAGTLGGFEEIYLIKAARVFVNENHQLVQEIFGEDISNFGNGTIETSSTSTVRILAENIAGVAFFFDPAGRTLTMHIAAFGSQLDPTGGGAGGVQPAGWPLTDDSTVNSRISLPTELLNRRIVLGSRVWRIRN